MDILVYICDYAPQWYNILSDYIKGANLEDVVVRKCPSQFYVQLIDGTRLYVIPCSIYNRWCKGRDYMHNGKHYHSGYIVKESENQCQKLKTAETEDNSVLEQ